MQSIEFRQLHSSRSSASGTYCRLPSFVDQDRRLLVGDTDRAASLYVTRASQLAESGRIPDRMTGHIV